MEDNRILDLFFERNQMAITATQEKYGGKLLRFAKQIVKILEDAQECVNDTYLKAWNTIPPQRPAYFQAFLMKICRFLASLPKKKRVFFVRRYWYLDSIKDIASRYRLSEGSVKVTLARTRAALADYLEKEGVSVL